MGVPGTPPVHLQGMKMCQTPHRLMLLQLLYHVPLSSPGPVAGVMARALPGRQEEPSAVPAQDRRDIDALYASAVQQVWSRTARLSADLLPTLQAGIGQEQQSQQQQQQQQRRQQQQEEQQEYVQLQQVQQVPLSIELCRPPAACSFLQPGLSFVGSQKLLQRGSLRREDQWTVRVVLHVSKLCCLLAEAVLGTTHLHHRLAYGEGQHTPCMLSHVLPCSHSCPKLCRGRLVAGHAITCCFYALS